MRRCLLPAYLGWVLAFAGLGSCVDLVQAQDDWKLEVVHLKNGNHFRGLVLEENEHEVVLRVVRRLPGRPTVLTSITFKRAEIRELALLEEKDRLELEAKLKALTLERQTWASLVRALDPATKQEKSPFANIDLKPTDWRAGKALSYTSTHFHIVSNARPDLVALSALQLEQIYAAYMRWLPPRVKSAPPTSILLPNSQADYQALTRELGLPLLNTAYFDLKQNQIVCPSGLQKLADAWSQAVELNQQALKKLDEQETELKKVYKGKLPIDVQAKLKGERNKLLANFERFRTESEPLLRKSFQPLYHEAWHAYVHKFVVQPGESQLPRWLEEGLAQVFELAVLEAGELRVEQPDPHRLQAVQNLLKKKELIPLADLCKAGPKQFLVAHNSEQEASDKHYLSAWAWAHFLTFQKKAVSTPAFEKYLQATQRAQNPVDALQSWLDQPIAKLEADCHEYFAKHRGAGSASK